MSEGATLGYSIDPDAVAWHGRSLWSATDLVVRSSWPRVEECLAEPVENAMADLREWFLAEWASIEWEIGGAADGAVHAALVLGAADTAAAAEASRAALTLRPAGGGRGAVA